jgi:type IV secretory pathway VirB2 component (pilin)
VFDLTLQSSATTITLTNVATSGTSKAATIILRQPSATGNTVSFANTINWTNAEVPVLASGIAKKLDIITIVAVGGQIFFGAHSMANVTYP